MAALLRSLAAQTLPAGDFEVLVVVDGLDQHQDAYREVLGRATGELGLPLRFEFQENAGQSVARHRAITAATAPWLVIVDDDMDLGQDFLAAHLEALEAGGEAAIGVGRVVPEEGWERQPLYEAVRTRAMLELHQGLARGTRRAQASAFVTQNVSLERARYLAVGGFDARLRLGEDTELGLRLVRAGGRFVFVEGAWAIHRSRVGAYATWLARQVEYGRNAVYIHQKLGRDPEANPLRNLVNGSRLNALVVHLACWSDPSGQLAIGLLRRLGQGLQGLGLTTPAIATHKAILAIAYHLGVRQALGSWRALLAEKRAFAALPVRPLDPT
jgi:GT2 family glycosyltransferase